MKKVFKSILAILTGFFIIVFLSVITDVILENTGVYPSMAMQLKYGFFDTKLVILATIYRTIYSLFGCYITARMAPNHSLRHALILGAIGFIFSTIGLITLNNRGPVWYPVALILVSFPCAWAGNLIYQKSFTGKKKK